MMRKFSICIILLFISVAGYSLTEVVAGQSCEYTFPIRRIVDGTAGRVSLVTIICKTSVKNDITVGAAIMGLNLISQNINNIQGINEEPIVSAFEVYVHSVHKDGKKYLQRWLTLTVDFANWQAGNITEKEFYERLLLMSEVEEK